MRLNKKVHYTHPWKVHDIAKDFRLLDLWEMPILADVTENQDFRSFLEAVKTVPRNPVKRRISIGLIIGGLLFAVRILLGKIFPLDKDINILPIPGCKETSLRERLTKDDLARSLSKQKPEGENKRIFAFSVVYHYENELLNELSNNTAHVLMHLGWVHKYGNYYTAQLAIYAKSRKFPGRLYLMLIMPFRRLVVYPSMAKNFKYKWEAYCSRIEKSQS